MVAELSRDCLHFLDVGVNEGIHIFYLFCKNRNEISLHWFEPDPILAKRLSENCSRNALAVFGNEAAVAEISTKAIFYRNLSDDSSGSLSSHFSGSHAVEPHTVNTVCLTDYFVKKEISDAIVKVDVEGAGIRVWSGLEASIARINYLIIEMLAPEIQEGLPMRIMRASGWHAYYIRDFDFVEATGGEFEYAAPFWNWMFCGLNSTMLAKRLRGTRFRVIPYSRRLSHSQSRLMTQIRPKDGMITGPALKQRLLRSERSLT